MELKRNWRIIGILAVLAGLGWILAGCVGITLPTAAFTASPTVGSAALTVQFTDQSAGNVSDWLWDFGDGATSTEQNPTHTYTTAGIYTVSLTVRYGGLKPISTETKTDYIKVASAGGYVPPPPSGTGSAADINTAIGNAGAGGLVLVGTGTYTGNVTIPAGTDGLTIRATSRPVIDGDLIVDSDDVTVDGFEATGDLETTAFASFANLTLIDTLIYGEVFNKTLSCADVVNAGESIQTSIDGAAGGETICVAPGTYTESIVVNKSLTLQSISGAAVTIIEGPTPLDPDHTYNNVVEITASNVVFDGFTVTAETQARQGVLADDTAGNAILKNLIATGIRANPNWRDAQGYAVTVNGAGSQILNTVAKNNDHGFTVGGDNASLKNLVAKGNGHGDHGGFDLWIGAANVEVDTFSAESGWDDGCGPNVYITGSAKNTILRNFTSHSETYCGIQIGGGFSGGGGTFQIIDSSISNKRAAGAHAGWYPAYGILEFCNPGAGYGCDFSLEITNTEFTDNDVGIGIGSAFAGYRPQEGTVDIAGCTLTGNDKGVWRHSGTADNGGAVTIHLSNIYGNTLGVDNELNVMDATNNWWGDDSGPKDTTGTTECSYDAGTDTWTCGDLNADGTGDKVSDNVDYCPWSLSEN